MLTYAAKLTREPWHIVEADVIALRQAGFSDAAILDINQVTGYYAFCQPSSRRAGCRIRNDSYKVMTNAGRVQDSFLQMAMPLKIWK